MGLSLEGLDKSFRVFGIHLCIWVSFAYLVFQICIMIPVSGYLYPQASWSLSWKYLIKPLCKRRRCPIDGSNVGPDQSIYNFAPLNNPNKPAMATVGWTEEPIRLHCDKPIKPHWHENVHKIKRDVKQHPQTPKTSDSPSSGKLFQCRGPDRHRQFLGITDLIEAQEAVEEHVYM